MPNTTNQGQDNKTTGGKSSGSGGAASGTGMQVSGEEIFLPEDTQPKVTKESDVFGQQQPAGQQPGGQTSTPKAAQQPPAQGKQPDQPDNKQPVASGSQNDEAAKQASQQVNQVLSGDFKPVTDALNQAKDTAGAVAGQVYEKAQDKAGSVITEQKKSLAEGLGSVADNIRKFGDSLNAEQSNPIGATAAKYGDTLAEQVENLSNYIERGDFRTFASDLQNFARRNPTAFVAGAFGLGLLAARFLKSSPRPANSGRNLAAGRARNSRKTLGSTNDKTTGNKEDSSSASSPTV